MLRVSDAVTSTRPCALRVSADSTRSHQPNDAARVLVVPAIDYGSRTSTRELILGEDTVWRLPDGHTTSIRSTLSALPRPKYSGYTLCDR